MAIKQRLDSPTNNFATLNPLANSTGTFSNGNLRIFHTSNQLVGLSTISYPLKGKYYSEFSDILLANITYRLVVISNITTGKQVELAMDGSWTNEAGTRTNGYLPSFSSSDVAGFWVDLENGEYAFSKNESFGSTKQFDSTFYANGVSASSADNVVFLFRGSGTIANWGVTVNTGQDPTFGGSKSPTTTYTDANGIGAFYYQPPTDALALCTANLPEMTPDVTGDVPQDYFKAVDYAGDNNTTKVIDSSNGINFVPDLIWVKNRTVGVNHYLVDSVRGAGSGKHLHSNTTASESTASTYTTNGGIASFGSTEGFTVYKGTDATYQGTNKSGNNFVAWCWKAGGAPDLTTPKPFAKNGVQYETLSAANITAGTITPTAMSVNTDAGFSIVSWTADGSDTSTIGHGLSSAPEIVIYKKTDSVGDWYVRYFEDADSYLRLNKTDAKDTGTQWGDHTASTITNFGYPSGNSIIAYCWHSVEGYSKFGSYTGNGSTDGPFVYCGFRPAFVMIKCSSVSSSYTSWAMYDNKRNTTQPAGANPIDQLNILWSNRSDSEGKRGDGTSANLTNNNLDIDFLSNGFRIPYGNAFENDSLDETFIFMAFAEQPFKYANAR